MACLLLLLYSAGGQRQFEDLNTQKEEKAMKLMIVQRGSYTVNASGMVCCHGGPNSRS
jgi:hypothetical protein